MNWPSFSRYARRSAIGRVATPDSIAACATHGASWVSSRGSNGRGMMYSAPKLGISSPYAAPRSLASLLASAAIARTHASFIASSIPVAPTSSAPRKMYGKHSALFTWFG